MDYFIGFAVIVAVIAALDFGIWIRRRSSNKPSTNSPSSSDSLGDDDNPYDEGPRTTSRGW